MREEENYLIHYGVLGMKWGLRKERKAWEKEVKSNWKAEKAKAKGDRSYKNSSAYKSARSERRKVVGAHLLSISPWDRNYMYGQYKKNGKSASETFLRFEGNVLARNLISESISAVGRKIAMKKLGLS